MAENKIFGADLNVIFLFGDGVENKNFIWNLSNEKTFLSVEVVEKMCQRLLEYKSSF